MMQVLECLFHKKYLDAVPCVAWQRLSRDMITIYKYIKGINAGEGGELLKNNTGTRVEEYKLTIIKIRSRNHNVYLTKYFPVITVGVKTFTVFICFYNPASLAPATVLAQQRTQIGRQTEKQAALR